ncbi:hypothetical protein OsJ_20439 [Oryza sativa Japonica Group]|uniref:Uncharacterized protein n=1 Tax=Oryza sativa subsp. japonica TaxID=39947 RepID=Q69YA9_ORYSJ|nr:hypothetical protein OsJ_20439 [Oryza sativa Japonica Group]KAF2925631.1 hypothetical protein DAI22_06g066900 [Oryza sativa Japonica Group]BAD35218.1 hypothetical protein [Oryza sativa Japonica Group]
MPFFPRSSTYAAYTIPPPPATPGRPDDDNDHYHEDEDKPLLPPIRHCRRQRTWVRRRRRSGGGSWCRRRTWLVMPVFRRLLEKGRKRSRSSGEFEYSDGELTMSIPCDTDDFKYIVVMDTHQNGPRRRR